tara:strand:- start:6332 stop:6688 length:357 start_codon:yes stop_codon:yes gene_type:complete
MAKTTKVERAELDLRVLKAVRELDNESTGWHGGSIGAIIALLEVKHIPVQSESMEQALFEHSINMNKKLHILIRGSVRRLLKTGLIYEFYGIGFNGRECKYYGDGIEHQARYDQFWNS